MGAATILENVVSQYFTKDWVDAGEGSIRPEYTSPPDSCQLEDCACASEEIIDAFAIFMVQYTLVNTLLRKELKTTDVIG